MSFIPCYKVHTAIHMVDTAIHMVDTAIHMVGSHSYGRHSHSYGRQPFIVLKAVVYTLCLCFMVSDRCVHYGLLCDHNNVEHHFLILLL